MDTNFDLTNTHVGTVGGYTRAQRAAIAPADTMKLKNTAVVKILEPVISTRDRITSFDPEELRSSGKTNFFSFVAGWREQVQAINIHLKSYYMHNVFVICQVVQRQQTDANGQPRWQVDANGARIQDANGNDLPLMEDIVTSISPLFDIWHNLLRQEVLESCRIYYQHAEDVDRQNLAWSYEFIMKNIDPFLQQTVILACENLPKYALSGPYAFYVVAEKIITSTQNLSHNVNSGLMLMSI